MEEESELFQHNALEELKLDSFATATVHLAIIDLVLTAIHIVLLVLLIRDYFAENPNMEEEEAIHGNFQTVSVIMA